MGLQLLGLIGRVAANKVTPWLVGSTAVGAGLGGLMGTLDRNKEEPIGLPEPVAPTVSQPSATTSVQQPTQPSVNDYIQYTTNTPLYNYGQAMNTLQQMYSKPQQDARPLQNQYAYMNVRFWPPFLGAAPIDWKVGPSAEQLQRYINAEYKPPEATSAIDTAQQNLPHQVQTAANIPRADAERWAREIDPAQMRAYVADILRDQFEQYRKGVPGDKLLSARVIGDLMQTYAALGGKFGDLGQTATAVTGKIAEQYPAQSAENARTKANILRDLEAERMRTQVAREQIDAQKMATTMQTAAQLSQAQAQYDANMLNLLAKQAQQGQQPTGIGMDTFAKILSDTCSNTTLPVEQSQQACAMLQNVLNQAYYQGQMPKYAQGGLVTPERPSTQDVHRYYNYMMMARKMGANPIPLQDFLTYARTAQMAQQSQRDDVPALIDGTQPAALQTGEYVLPKDVVLYHGLKSIQKLVEQARKGNQQ